MRRTGLKLESFPFLKKIALSTANLSHLWEIVHLEVFVMVRFCSIGERLINGREAFIGDELFIAPELLVKLVPFCQGVM